MKKFLMIGVLALGILPLARQEASAWINHKFGVGLNWAWQSGGNSFGWGLFRGGQPPGPDHGPAYPGWGGHGYAPVFSPAPPVGPHAFDFTPEPPYAAPAPTPVNQAWQYNRPVYQSVGYPSYSAPVYYYPATYYYGR